MRIAKYLAQAGIASRRQAEVMVTQGRIKLNGAVISELYTSIDPDTDVVELDGHVLAIQKPVYILLNKPAGFICTVSDPQGRPTIMELVKDVEQRIFPVGRLDYDTEGLILLTNDGEFANVIIHPRYKIDKTYQATVRGEIKDQALAKLRQGVELEDGVTAPARVELINRNYRQSIVRLTIHEGRKRQVRRMLTAVGYPVLNLKRISLGFLTLQGLQSGAYRNLQAEEIEGLKTLALKT